jgi:serine/threonine protein kinase/tetratricopeptide (TPR) repeat protein
MPLSPGTRLGPYEIVSPLGVGGMGEVYRARDTRLGREVAIKVLPADLASDRGRLDRFEKEARLVASLSHPNILALHDFGQADGVLYAVTELLEGDSLRRRLSVETLPIRKVIEIGAAVAEGLAAAHGKGIVHRDLKPDNIFLTFDGQVKILDFGLARTVEILSADARTAAPTTPAPTEPGSVMGTVGYMAPEQVRGSAADARSDIFAFGCVLHEMVSGGRAFAAPTAAETMAAILRDSPEPVPQTRRIAGLDRILARCLEKSPDERFQSARDLAFALREMSVPSANSASIPRTVSETPRRGLRRSPWLIAGLAVAATLAGVLMVRTLRPHARPAGAGKIQALAVLPLANLSGDPQQEYFADGMTEELITVLSQIGALRVSSRTSAMRYKGTQKSLPEIARELGVDAVIEGSVLRVGDRVRITAQLIAAATDKHLWASSYDRDLRDVLALQGDVARAIADEIGVRLTSEERTRFARTRKVAPEAYEAYLKGKFHMTRSTAPDAQKSLEYFQQAAAKQPDYALAYAAIAGAYERLAGSSYTVLSPKEAFPKAKAAAMQALTLDPTLAEAYADLGWASFVFDRDWTTAENQFRRALRLSPSDQALLQNYSLFLARMSRFDEAIREVKRRQELDPLSLGAIVDVGSVLHFARRDGEAIPWFRRAIDMDPTFHRAHWGLGLSLIELKRYDDAIVELRQAADLSSGGVMLGSLGYAYAVANHRAEALEIVQRLEEDSKLRYVPPAAVAIVLSGLGEREQAVTWLEKAEEERDPWVTGLKVEPMFDSLRSEPRFLELLHRVGLD